MNIFSILAKRFTSETPNFWKKIMRLGVVLTSIGVLLMGVGSDAVPDYIILPEWMKTVGSYIATIGFVLTAVSKITTDDSDLSKE